LRWKTVVVTGAVLFLAGLLLGFIPEYQKASKLAGQLDRARLEGQLTEIRELAALSYLGASKMNYGSASEDAGRMFGVAQDVANHTKDTGLRKGLNGLLTYRDAVMRQLSTADASVLEPLQLIVQKTRSELKR